MALTQRQKQVLDFLVEFVEKNGYNPSYEEIAGGMNLASLATVHKHIAALEAKHYVRRSFNQSRSLEVSAKCLQEYRLQHEASRPGIEVPLMGRIAAGAPVQAFESNEKLNFADFVGNSDTFALEVRGDSMIEDHICSGDYVLVQKTGEARDGEIVVALVEGSETTLKRFYHEPNGKVRLQPANSSMEPIVVSASSVELQGRVLAVLRKY
jgi:repressor LexA